MAQVVVTIAGRTYRMNCDDGQEEHLEKLAGEVDRRMGDMRQAFGEIGDQRLVVMTALTIADELDNARKRIESLQGETSALRAELEREQAASGERNAALDEALERAAARLDTVTQLIGARPC